MNPESSTADEQPPDLIDIGCNLTHDSFDPDRDAVIGSARSAGVVQIVVTGASESGSGAALELAHRYPGELFATAGVHPHHADEVTSETLSVLEELVGEDEVVAVGETGLDYFRDFSPRPTQRSAFERHIELAVTTRLPMFLHMRDAHEDFHAMVREHRDHLSNVVVHCFTGTQGQLHEYLDLDCHIGITGWICDERRGEHMKDYLVDIPQDRLMVETDAPYLKPRDLKPRVKTRRNEPRWLPWIVDAIARARGVPVGQVARHTTANARRFFGFGAP
jgi:TatD DNase family protein